MCDKRTYETYNEAAKALSLVVVGRQWKNRRLAKKKPKRAYKCELCNKYHLTSKKSNHRARRIRT